MMQRRRGTGSAISVVLMGMLVAACSTPAASTPPSATAAAPSAAASAGSAAPTAKPDLGKITVVSGSQTSWQTYLTAIAPVKLGYFEEEGFSDVEWTFAGNDTNSLAAVVAGQAEFAVGVATDSVLKVAEQGQPVYIIGSISNKLTHMLFGKGVSSLADLKGKTVATDETAGTIDGYIIRAVESAGLKATDITLVRAGGSSERYAALENGIVDAAIIGSSLIPRAKEAGFTQLYDLTTLYDEYLQRVTIVNADFANANPAKVEAFMRATVRAHDWLKKPESVEPLWALLVANDPQIDKTHYAEALNLQLAALPRDALFTQAGFDIVLNEIKADAPTVTFDRVVRLDAATKAATDLGVKP
jgi:ABC-type nitrate/sulfonate/bicarbonate transport system substrate-binding protein